MPDVCRSCPDCRLGDPSPGGLLSVDQRAWISTSAPLADCGGAPSGSAADHDIGSAAPVRLPADPHLAACNAGGPSSMIAGLTARPPGGPGKPWSELEGRGVRGPLC